MRKIALGLLALVLVSGLGIALGAGIRYAVEKATGLASSNQLVSGTANSEDQSNAAPNLGMCFPELGLYAEFPERYRTERRENNLILVTRDGDESFLVLPIVDQNPREKYQLPEKPDFETDNDLRLGVNLIETDNQTSYFVNFQKPFFIILVHGTENDDAARADIRRFLNSVVMAKCGLD